MIVHQRVIDYCAESEQIPPDFSRSDTSRKIKVFYPGGVHDKNRLLQVSSSWLHRLPYVKCICPVFLYATILAPHALDKREWMVHLTTTCPRTVGVTSLIKHETSWSDMSYKCKTITLHTWPSRTDMGRVFLEQHTAQCPSVNVHIGLANAA